MKQILSLKNHFIFILFSLILFDQIIDAQIIAFPGAQGWAASTEGGRGGQIIKVTNLNSSGTGSFAAAISASEPRIVVFEVGGIIDLNGSNLYLDNPYITIAGQTAPFPGITLIDGAFYIRTHDVILQHIKVRPGASRHVDGWEPDGISATSAYNVIIDHCSITWAVDENCSTSGPRFEGETPDDWRENTSHTITMSNNIIAEGLSNATHTKGEHSKGSLIHDNVTEMAITNNLYTSNVHRNPLFKGGARGVVVNNYIYNPRNSSIRYILNTTEWEGYDYQTGMMTVVGNVLQYGPNTNNITLLDVDNGPCEVYMEDNIAKNVSGVYVTLYDGEASKLVVTRSQWHANIKPILAIDLKESIIQNVGARPWDRDEIDTRIINEMLSGTGSIIDYETEAGGYPTHDSTSTTFMEEEWNLNYMLKVSPYINIIKPVTATTFLKDSLIIVEVDTGAYPVGIKNIELFVEGLSEGKDTLPPYQWMFNRSTPGNYELIAIAQDDSRMIYASDTIHINIIDTIFSSRNRESMVQPTVSAVKCYPNPFNHATNIKFQIPVSNHVTLKIFTVHGHEVATLVNEGMVPGDYEVKWDARNFPGGVYFYRLKVGTLIESKKLVLIK